MSVALAAVVALAYAGVAGLLWGAWRRHEPSSAPAARLLQAGVALHVIQLALAARDAAVPGFAESLSGLALGLMLAVAWAGRTELRALAVFLVPVGTGLFVVAQLVPAGLRVAALRTMGPSWWLPLHVGLVLAAATGFFVELGVLSAHEAVRRRLKQKRFGGLHRLPSLETLARMQVRALAFGLACLLLGLAAGAAWAAEGMRHSEWITDPKVLLSSLTWLVYAAALGLRVQQGRISAGVRALSLLGFALLIFSLVGFDLVTGGFHGRAG